MKENLTTLLLKERELKRSYDRISKQIKTHKGAARIAAINAREEVSREKREITLQINLMTL